MPQWQAAVLIIVSFGSLIIALYCLFFMVPVKRFWERIHTLGGGMKGIEAYVLGFQDEIRERLAELEEATRRQIAQSREASEEELDRLAEGLEGFRPQLERLRKDVQSLQAELREAASDTMKVGQSTAALGRQLEQLRGDFDALDVELRESVRQLVSESFSTVESTVLSALDAVQQEMLYGVSEASPPPEPRPPRREKPAPRFGGGGAPRTRDNIIEMAPLFAGLRGEEEGDSSQEPTEEDEGGGRADGSDEGDDEA
ncbi:MAG: hypothetical protein ACYS1C_01505 [Planctomycetota bacterium]|jgi:hypothetical protein